MSPLRQAVIEYLTLRRNLGFKLLMTGAYLHQAVDFIEAQGASHITVHVALQWAMQPKTGKPGTWAGRLMALRGFARYYSVIDPRTEIPPKNLLPYRPNRARPYLYTAQEIEQLMARACKLQSEDPLRGRTYAVLLGLLAVTGLRIGEALALEPRDVDVNHAVLTIRGAKYGKLRLVPLHPSTQEALFQYRQERDAVLGAVIARRFFVSSHGKPLIYRSVRKIFLDLCREIGLRPPEHGDPPRLHAFRHRFAMETLSRWYDVAEDVERRLPVLSTFLGHTSLDHTYWYLSARPELMAKAMRRLERRWEKPL